MTLPVFRIFVSSPGDVSEERVLAERTIRRLAQEYASVARIEGIFWEHEPLAATSTFQAQILRPSESDVAVCILWARLGTRLPSDFRRADGSAYESGTAFEFEDAAESFKARGTPALLVYRKTIEPTVSLKDEDTVLEMLRQRRSLQQYLQRWFHNQEDGSLAAAFHPFDAPARFEELLEQHLRKLIERRFSERLASPARETWQNEAPFRGLALFDVQHAPIFFGRSRATASVLANLRARAEAGTAFVVILGMSGSGKSSLARAGVLPLLMQPGVIPGVARWESIVMRPTEAGVASSPIRALVTAWLGRAGRAAASESDVDSLVYALGAAPENGPRHLLGADSAGDAPHIALVVDQLEEIFTMESVRSEERLAFVTLLSSLARSGRVWIVATMRSDFYARCEELPPLVKLMDQQGQYHLLTPSSAELAQIVRSPLRLAGLRLEEDATTGERLEDLLLGATVGNPGSLPLLEFTLEELYKRRCPDGLLTLDAYRSLGGVEGALATRAEEVFSSLDAEAQATFPTVLRRLVVIDPTRGDSAARRSAPLDAFTDASTRRLVSAFIDARLFVADRGEQGVATVTVAHEALIRHWPRVQEWLSSDREYLATRSRVEAAASLWRTEDESPLFLLRAGRALHEALDIVRQRREDLDDALVRFVDSSWRFSRRNRFVRLAIQVGAVAATLVFLASSYAQWQESQRSYREARLQRDQLLKQSEIFLPSALELEFPGDTLRPDQKAMLSLLLNELHAADFRGTLYLQGHLGRFLVVRDATAKALRLRSLRDDCVVVECAMYPAAGDDAVALTRLELALRTFGDSLRLDGIDVQIASLPTGEALEPYPDSARVAAWNAVARRNHRVEVRLVPAESQR